MNNWKKLKIKLADLCIHIDHTYDYLDSICSGYLCGGAADLTVSISEADIQKEADGRAFDPGYLEGLAACRKIAEQLPFFGAFLMHGAVIDVEGTGIAFLARSGVGKTTHMLHWKTLLKEKVTVVNGDKPIIRIDGGKIYAYGTPWAGKERLQKNMKTPLKKVCFIERSERNECIKLSNQKNILQALLIQVYRPADSNAYIQTLDIFNALINQLDFYQIKCTKEPASAKTAYEGLGL